MVAGDGSMTCIPADLIPLRKASALVHLSQLRLRRLSGNGEFPPIFKFGRYRYVSEAAVHEWAEDQVEHDAPAWEPKRQFRRTLADLPLRKRTLRLPKPDNAEENEE